MVGNLLCFGDVPLIMSERMQKKHVRFDGDQLLPGILGSISQNYCNYSARSDAFAISKQT